jgi:membrane associated rhomboid family serine protease
VIPLKNDIPQERFPTIMVALIIANVLAYFWQLSVGPEQSIAFFGAVPRTIVQGGTHDGLPVWITLVTAMFLHGGFLHLAGNMLFLWIFGGNVEDRLGHLGFLVFYLSCGLLAGAAQVFAAPTSPIPMIGASGAIAGVLGAYFMLFPRSRVLTLFWFVFWWRVYPVHAVFFLGVWFLMQLLSLPQAASGGGAAASGGVAFAAHVGGFIAGLLLVRVFGALHRQPPRRFEAAG